MKFITEDDLRVSFQRQSFSSYELLPETRLTPGGRQFLSDKRIVVQEIKAGQESAVTKDAIDTKDGDREPEKETEKDLFFHRLKSIQAMFLEYGIELMKTDVLLGEEVFKLERDLASLGQGGECSRERTGFTPCTGIGAEDCLKPLSDCFELTGFHAQSEKGREILLLHRLRCCLRELLAESGEALLCFVINRLSQMICREFGGKLCQREK